MVVILSREDAARGSRARYSLTEAGIQTLPIILALGKWGLDWHNGTQELRIRQELMRNEGQHFIEEFTCPPERPDTKKRPHAGTSL